MIEPAAPAPAAAPPATPPAGTPQPPAAPPAGVNPPQPAAQPPGTPPAAAPSIFQEGDGHQFAPGWAGEHSPYVDRFGTPQDLAQGYTELMKKMSAGERVTNVTSYPGQDNPEGRAAWNQAMGVPEDPNGYGLGEMELPEGMNMPPEMATAYSSAFQELGVPPAMAQALAAKHLEITTQFEQQHAAQDQVTQQANLQVEQAKLMQVHGDNLPVLQAKAQGFLEARGHNLTEAQMNDPAVAGAILDLISQSGEDMLSQNFGGAGTHVPNQNASQRVRTIQEQAAQIRQGVQIPNADPLAEGYAKGDEEAVKQFRALSSQLANR